MPRTPPGTERKPKVGSEPVFLALGRLNHRPSATPLAANRSHAVSDTASGGVDATLLRGHSGTLAQATGLSP